MAKAKVFSSDEVNMQMDVQTISGQLNNLQKGFDEFVAMQQIQEDHQESRLKELERYMTKEKALYTIRQIEVRIIYSMIAALLTYLLTRIF